MAGVQRRQIARPAGATQNAVMEIDAEEPQALPSKALASPLAEATDASIDVPVPAPAVMARLPEVLQEALPTAGSPLQEEPDDELPMPKRAPLAVRKSISFNLQGAQKAMAAAQANLQVQAAVEAARQKRLNVKDAATQTVRDPERQDGEIVTIWRLRPRGMESFPHFAKPKKAKRKAAMMSASFEQDVDQEEAESRKQLRAAPLSGTIDLDGGDAENEATAKSMTEPQPSEAPSTEKETLEAQPEATPPAHAKVGPAEEAPAMDQATGSSGPQGTGPGPETTPQRMLAEPVSEPTEVLQPAAVENQEVNKVATLEAMPEVATLAQVAEEAEVNEISDDDFEDEDDDEAMAAAMAKAMGIGVEVTATEEPAPEAVPVEAAVPVEQAVPAVAAPEPEPDEGPFSLLADLAEPPVDDEAPEVAWQ